MTHVYVEAETYTVSVLPDTHPERDSYELTLQRHGNRWAVRLITGRWWDRDGGSKWMGRRISDGQQDRFLMSLAEAKEVAVSVAPWLRVNGGPTAAEILTGAP